jgi:hypothetical protein
MRNAVVFGLLGAFATSTAFLADLFLAPAMLVLVTPRRVVKAGQAFPLELGR